MLNRNLAILLGVGLVVVVVIGGAYMYKNHVAHVEGTYPYTLPPLPYAFNALEPYIDAETMTIHYTKHHQAYVDKLNDAIKSFPEVRNKSLEYLLTHLAELPDYEYIHTAVRDNGGGHYNHSFFWLCMTPTAQQPVGLIKDLIEKTFGSLESFKEQFNKAALSVFGSGWAWLVLTKDGGLKIVTTSNQDTPITQGLIPLLGLDVWEHAYYLKYQNRRAEYSDAWWHVVNWEQVEKNYVAAQNSIEQKGTVKA